MAYDSAEKKSKGSSKRQHGLRTAIVGWLFTGLVAFGLFAIPGVEFISLVIGNLVTGLDQAIINIFSVLPAPLNNLGGLGYVAYTGLEVAVFNCIPLSWVLSYPTRQADAAIVILMIAPFLISGFLTGLCFAKSPKDSLITSIMLIASNCMWAVMGFFILPAIFLNIPAIAQSGTGAMISGLLNGLASGITDLPMGWSAILAQLEGGGFFAGANILAGLLKQSGAIRHGEATD
jgi:hypothetical protein